MEESTCAIDRDVPCLACGYNLRGLQPAGRCPECGRAIAPSLAERWVGNGRSWPHIQCLRCYAALFALGPVLWLVAAMLEGPGHALTGILMLAGAALMLIAGPLAALPVPQELGFPRGTWPPFLLIGAAIMTTLGLLLSIVHHHPMQLALLLAISGMVASFCLFTLALARIAWITGHRSLALAGRIIAASPFVAILVTVRLDPSLGTSLLLLPPVYALCWAITMQRRRLPC